MEFSMLTFSVSILVLTLSSILIVMLSKRRGTNKAKLAPKAPGWLPIVGHLHFFANGQEPPHVTLEKIAEKIGPIFSINIGSHQALVVNTWELAKQCLKTNDKAFANRPKAVAIEIFSYNYSMFGFSPYGEYWRELRKIVSLELLSNHKVDKLKYVAESHMKEAIKDLYNKCTISSNNRHISFELQRWARDVMSNLILRIVVNKRSPRQWEIVIRDAMHFMINNFAVSDAFPWLRWLDIGGNEREMKKLKKVIDCTLSEWLEEHKGKKRNQLEEDEDEDFMDVLLSVLKDHQQLAKSAHDFDTIVKATCLSIILGASETTAAALVSALSLMLNNRHVLEKAKNEIEHVVGRDRAVQESDGKQLLYLNAIIKETLRLYPPTLSSPRESIEDCTVDGYHIPSGTHLFVNLWKIQRDPTVWDDALEFRPERFLTKYKDIDVKGHHSMLLPFGGGRRICSGVSFSLQVLNLPLASMLQAFEIETVSGKQIDMSGQSTPIEALIIPRLPPHLY